MNAEARTLAEIRALVARIDPEWQLAHDGDGMLVDAVKGDERLEILRCSSLASSDDMRFAANAPAYVRFLLRLVDRAIASVRAHGGRACGPASAGAADDGRAPVDVSPNFAAEAAIKCGEPAFKKFMIERHGLESPATDDRTAQKLRSLLGIGSRRELNDDDAAAERWKRLRGEFDAWKRAG